MELPPSVISIGQYAFYFCSSLNKISIPSSVCSIGKYCFQFCPIVEISFLSINCSFGKCVFSNIASITISNTTNATEKDSNVKMDLNVIGKFLKFFKIFYLFWIFL